MPDKSIQMLQADEVKTPGNEYYELQYLERKLGVSRQQVEDAIKAVGNDRNLVEQHLLKGRRNSL